MHGFDVRITDLKTAFFQYDNRVPLKFGHEVSTGGETVFTITGSGWGHNVGMSQWGAYAMAQQGYTYLDILTFYYTGIEVRQP